MKAKLVVHVGIPKTGTSALQRWFLENKILMRQKGIHYPKGIGDEGIISSGNGRNLIKYLNNEIPLDKTVRSYQPPVDVHHDVLISSELLPPVIDGNIDKLQNLAAAMHTDLKVVACVRNIYEWLYSNFQQRVKRHCYTKDFESYVKSVNRLFYLDFIRSLNDHGVEFSLISYDHNKNDLLGSFLKHLWGESRWEGCDLKSLSYINRSLSPDEILLLREVSLAFPSKKPQQSISRKIADHLVINYPEVETGVLYSEELEEYLERRFGKYVREFNADLANRFGFGVGISAKDRSECFSELPAYISDNTIKRAVGAVENPDVIDYLNKLN